MGQRRKWEKSQERLGRYPRIHMNFYFQSECGYVLGLSEFQLRPSWSMGLLNTCMLCRLYGHLNVIRVHMNNNNNIQIMSFQRKGSDTNNPEGGGFASGS